ncbi:sensor histidine kinase [Labedaea rhizosphaerae]|nr:histidine kinase [Labedaea rhizosphaerae]
MDTTADVGTVRRWLAGLLALTFVFDFMAALADYGDHSLIGSWLSLPLAVCALAAGERPLLMALLGCGYELLASAAVMLAHVDLPYGPGIATFQVTEMAAGAALVGFVVWRLSIEAAIWTTLAVVLAAVGSLILRLGATDQFSNRQLAYSGLAGLVVLAVAVAVGAYLRRSTTTTDPERRAFARRQWPLAAALGLLMFVDFAAGTDAIVSGSLLSLSFLLPIIGAAVSAVAAYFGPKQPVRMALFAAGATVLGSWLMLPAAAVLHDYPRLLMPVTAIGAHMALVAYVVRYADRRQATLSVAALVVADALALVPSLPMNSRHGFFGDLRDYLMLGGLLLVMAAATGQYFRSRDRDRNQTVRAAVAGAQQAERMALARELHDVVAHHVTGIVVAAQAARLVADRDPSAAGKALARIEDSGVEALAAMRRLVASMRGAPPAGSSAAAEQATQDLRADLEAVVGSVTGPIVDLTVELPQELPQEVGRSVLRIVQESLTNVGKHARDARTVRVAVTTEQDEVSVSVVDDGSGAVGAPVGGSGGYGLIGMRERVDLLGGRFEAGAGAGGGWTVTARLPLGEGEK